MEPNVGSMNDLVFLAKHLIKLHEDFLHKVAQVEHTLANPIKGDSGKDGRHGAKGDKGDPPPLQDVIVGLLPYVPKPPVIDHEKIATLAAGKIKLPIIPKPKDGKDAVVDHEKLAQIVIDKLAEGKLLKPEHIDGLANQMTGLRNHVAVRGGGDTVTAGTGVIITTSNGVKTINAAGTGYSILTATGTINDSNKVFTFVSTPILVVVNNNIYKNGNGVTIVGTTATLDSVVGTGGSIFALG